MQKKWNVVLVKAKIINCLQTPGRKFTTKSTRKKMNRFELFDPIGLIDREVKLTSAGQKADDRSPLTLKIDTK